MRPRTTRDRPRIDAKRFLTTITAEVLRGDYVDPNDPTTLREYARPLPQVVVDALTRTSISFPW